MTAMTIKTDDGKTGGGETGGGLSLTIPALLQAHMAERPDKVLFANEHVELTYSEAEARSRTLAKGLLAAGAGKGTHIGLLLPTGPEFIVSLLAISRIGAVALPFSTLSTPPELRQLLTQSDTAFLIAAGEFRNRRHDEALREAFPDVDLSRPQPWHLSGAPWLRRIWFVGTGGEERHPDCSIETLGTLGAEIDDALLKAAEASVRPADRFAIIHTSGSTSTPKGVIHQHGTLLRHLANINAIRSLTDADVLFATSPWFWIAGFAFGLVGVFAAGGRIVCSNSQDAGTVLDLIEAQRPTTTNGYYPNVNWLAQAPEFAGRDFSWLRRGNLWPILAKDAQPSDPSWRHDIYGMSEAGGAVSLDADEGNLPEHLRGAAGRICPGFEARVVDPDTGEDRAPGEIGELWLRGSLMMEGYYGKPRAEVFAPDGWWHSSDAVAIDAEGYVFLKGRLGNMIKTAGANVAPREVEAVLGELTGGKLCIVLGIPDKERGEAVVGVIVTENVGEYDEAALRSAMKRLLSSYKIPRRILQIRQADIPTLSSGKIDMPRMKQWVEQTCTATKS